MSSASEGFSPSEPKAEAYLRARELKDLELSGPMPCVILVNPFLDSNVGSVARCMLNFGLTELRVVDPVCDIRSDNARALAAGAVEILDNARVYATLSECVADLQRVMATTIRPRGMSQLIYSPESAAELIMSSLHNASSGTSSSPWILQYVSTQSPH
jgi:tRNA C32,U32 (ribose-2'-O)-methylase TrmJ